MEFANVRYFRRCHCAGEEPANTATLNASTVLNLRRFDPSLSSTDGAKHNTANELDANNGGADDNERDARETLDFLKRYLNLTHCDLFFADAAILVEGTAEKLLLPQMIEQVALGLRQRYLTVLEVGGAYSHLFACLFKFLSIPYLVITDIDSVDPQNNRSACRADTPGAVSSNAALKFFLGATSVEDFVALDADAQCAQDRRRYIAYQRPSVVNEYEANSPMHGRTFEETFAYCSASPRMRHS